MNVYFVLILFLINQILAFQIFSSRIAGIITQKVASSNSIYNIFSILSSLIITFQSPLLSVIIEKKEFLNEIDLLIYFKKIILFTFLGGCIGALLIPFFYRIISHLVLKLNNAETILSLIFLIIPRIFSTNYFYYFKIPNLHFLKKNNNLGRIKKNQIIANIIAYSLTTGASLSCLLAGFIRTEFRMTCMSLSGIISGFGILIMALIIEPYHSVLVDRVIANDLSLSFFKKHISYVVLGRLFGIFLSSFLIYPFSRLVLIFVDFFNT